MTQAGVPATAIASTLSAPAADDQRSRLWRRALAGSTVARIAAALMFATVLIALPLRAAFADEDRRDDRGYERGRGHQRSHERGRERDRERDREYYRYRVYAPPPVYYRHEESPGIRLFFPIEIH
jgi:hypothetical protein